AFCAIGGLIGSGAKPVIRGELSPGALSAFVFYALLVAGPVGALSGIYAGMPRAAGAPERPHEVFSVPPRVPHRTGARVVPVTGDTALAFEDVSFAYLSRPEAQALSDISFSIPQGKTLAIVGPSGAGKTTLFQLLLRFYDPQSGRVILNGTDIRD